MSEAEEPHTGINELEKWLEQNGPKLFLFARQQVGNHADAQDVYQEAIVKVLKETLETGESRIPPIGRMFLAIKHSAIDLHRSRVNRSKREQRYGEQPSETGLFSCKIERDEQTDALHQAIRTLPPEQQEVVVLKVWGEQTFKGIADILGIPQNTAASRFRYGLSQLRSTMNLQAL